MSIGDIIGSLRAQIQAGALTPVEFVAAYIVGHLSLRDPGRWLVGKRQEASSQQLLGYTGWRPLSEYHWLNLTSSEKARLEGTMTTNMVQLFAHWNLKKMPSYVNEAVVNWALGKRKVELLHFAPTPLEVLQMQARGSRCVTAFCEDWELSRILQDTYPPYEKRDALKFLIHDLQHLEKFQGDVFYYEQVGFSSLIAERIGRLPFHIDDQYQQDLDHAFSDINACSVHLLEFFKAKSKLSEERRRQSAPGGTQQSTAEFDAQFQAQFVAFMSDPTDNDECRNALKNLCGEFSHQEANYLRTYFHERGCKALGCHAPLIEESDIKMKKKKEKEPAMQEGLAS